MTSENAMVEMQGIKAELLNGATVFGAFKDDAVIWVFEKDGITTPLLLSHQAVEAMMGIWQALREDAA